MDGQRARNLRGRAAASMMVVLLVVVVIQPAFCLGRWNGNYIARPRVIILVSCRNKY